MNKVLQAFVYFFSYCVLAVCASNPLVSPYVNPEEGKAFKYGNFCGPSFPKFSVKYTNDISHSDLLIREAKILTTPAVDDIDRVCRAHDICYDYFGHDNRSCDRTLSLLLRDNYNPPRDLVSYWGTGCKSVGEEIISGVIFLKPTGGSRQERTVNTILKSPFIAFDMGYKVLNASNMMLGDWPAEGTCNIKLDERALNRLIADKLAEAFADQTCHIPQNFRLLKTPEVLLACKEDVQSMMRNSFTLSDIFWRENTGREYNAITQQAIKTSRDCIRSKYDRIYRIHKSQYKRVKLLKQCNPKS